MANPNIYDPEWDDREAIDGFRVKRSRSGYRLGMRRLGLSVWELPPGEAAYPYHLHLTEEEAVVVLEGSPRLRTPEGWRRLERGEIVSFPVGPEGAHQIHNDSDEAVRLIAISTNGETDVVRYPDSGKVAFNERRPDGSGDSGLFLESEQASYFDGERPPR